MNISYFTTFPCIKKVTIGSESGRILEITLNREDSFLSAIFVFLSSMRFYLFVLYIGIPLGLYCLLAIVLSIVFSLHITNTLSLVFNISILASLIVVILISVIIVAASIVDMCIEAYIYRHLSDDDDDDFDEEDDPVPDPMTSLPRIPMPDLSPDHEKTLILP